MIRKDRRIVVTGIGVCTPLSRDVNDFFRRLCNGESSIKNLSDSKQYPWFKDYKIQVASLFDRFAIDPQIEKDPNVNLDFKDIRRMEDFARFALEASYNAVQDSGILDCYSRRLESLQDRVGITIGVGFGGAKEIGKQQKRFERGGMEKVDGLFVSKAIGDAAAGNIARAFGFHATECKSISTACASGASAIADAYKSIYMRDADVMVAGGCEEAGCELICGGFGNLGALSVKGISRPFDINRDGFVMGEGAGILVLENLEHAKSRGAKIYAELLGYGITQDASHLTQPREDARYMTKAMNNAMFMARVMPEEIDYINAHGTSTKLNDALEIKSIKRALGIHAYSIYLNSTKSMIGHTFGGAGGIEAIVTVKTLETGKVHPTANLEEKDPECDLNCTNQTLEIKSGINYALSNSFGFYGHNSCLCFGKYKGD